MGLLDEILGGIARGGLGGPAQGQVPTGPARQAQPQAAGGGAFGNVVVALLPVILEMLASRSAAAGAAARRGPATGNLAPGGFGDAGGLGGLGGLLEQLQKAGLGAQASSWIGTGSNMPIDREDITQVFGRERVGQIAERAGISEEEASGGLAALLPEVVDHLTPQGQMPGLDDLVAGVHDMQRRLDQGSR